MNAKTVVRLSNIIGIIAIVLLIYWVFIFVSIQVFGFKVFRENMTQTFYLSILGILALMMGALILNIMFNLTRIAQKHNQDEISSNSWSRFNLWWLIAGSFHLVFGLLWLGDYRTSQKKEKMLTLSAESIIEQHNSKLERLCPYQFDQNWVFQTEKSLKLLSFLDKNFPQVSIMVKDTIDTSPVFLNFRQRYHSQNDTLLPAKERYLIQTNLEERNYLNQVFEEGAKQTHYSAHDGHYELYVPYKKDNHVVVLYFSDFQRYGKIGS